MATRSAEQVRKEIEAERHGLEHAATTIRSESGNVAKRAAIVGGAMVAAVVTVKIVARVFHRDDPGRDKRARLPFLGTD